jgi:Dullard-like phosphatase family protein
MKEDILNEKTNDIYYNERMDENNNNNTNFYNNNNYLFAQKQQIRLPQPDPPFLPPRQNKSEISQKKFTLILDLDETLVRYKINENDPDEAKVIFRPGLFYFLNKIYPLFDIVIWTIATKEYADPIIDLIEENKKYFIARLFREHATIKNNNYIKDLNNLGRDLSTIIIIDDKETNFCFQKQNGILIKPFFGSYMELKNDLILYDLFKILTKIILDKSHDVRHGISKYKYEIKQKITKSYNILTNGEIYDKTNNINNNSNNNNIYDNINTKNYLNNNILNNNNYILKNNIINITQNYDNNSKISRCYSMCDSISAKNYSRK